jgi:hypothetical protein
MSLRNTHFALFSATFILGLAYVRFSSGRGSYRPLQQPFTFNHYVHTHNPDKPVECSGCHRGVETSYHATLPGIEVCSSCHLEPKGDTEKEKQFIAEYVDNEKPLPWQRLFVLPDHAFFSHRLHVVRGAIECQTCHGAMDMRTSPPSRPLRVLTMNTCMDCHEERQVSRDCNTCHR